ncbi:Protein DOG1-like 4, partial [Cucurbita argyrosperma subsp. argyrosperma]
MSSGLNFTSFYATWFDHLRHLIHQLSSTPTDHHHHLVHTIISHYSEYFRVKSLAAEKDPLSVFSAPWATSFERSLHWVAGWRPTTTFHLIYSQSTILFQSQIADILHAPRTGDLGDLSPSQFRHEESELIQRRVEASGKGEGLVSIIKKADDLRLRTVQKVVELLTPKQAVEFLIAAAELQFGVREWGMNEDRQRGNHPDT